MAAQRLGHVKNDTGPILAASKLAHGTASLFNPDAAVLETRQRAHPIIKARIIVYIAMEIGLQIGKARHSTKGAPWGPRMHEPREQLRHMGERASERPHPNLAILGESPNRKGVRAIAGISTCRHLTRQKLQDSPNGLGCWVGY